MNWSEESRESTLKPDEPKLGLFRAFCPGGGAEGGRADIFEPPWQIRDRQACWPAHCETLRNCGLLSTLLIVLRDYHTSASIPCQVNSRAGAVPGSQSAEAP